MLFDIHLSHLLAVLLVVTDCDARSTQVSAQYTVADGSGEPKRTFGPRGIVEDAVIEDGGILTKYSTRPTRNSPRGQKRRPAPVNPSQDYEQIPFQPEFFAVKGKVLDDDEPIPEKPKLKLRPARGKTYTKQAISYSSPTKPSGQLVPTKNPFKFPYIQNEDAFESKLQAAPSAINTKKYKLGAEDSLFTYSTIKFNGDDDNDDSYVGKAKSKAPKRSTSINQSQSFNLEQTFGEPQTIRDSDGPGSDDHFSNFGGFKPSGKFAQSSKGLKSPVKLFKSPEDDFKDSDFYDFSIRPRPGQPGNAAGGKFKSDLGVKTLSIKGHKKKFDPQAQPQMQGGFKPSFKLRDFPHIHGADLGTGIASSGQIKTFYDATESERDERIKQKFSKDSNPASKAQFLQFLKAKEDERLEKLVEEQFRLHQQKQIAQDKELELKHQQQVLRLQKEKLKQVEKHLSEKVTRESNRPKRRPNGPSSSRRQRNPSSIIFSGPNNGQSAVPHRTVNKDGPYRVKFNV